MTATTSAAGNARENDLDYGLGRYQGYYFDWPFINSTNEEYTDYKDKVFDYIDGNSSITIESVTLKDRDLKAGLRDIPGHSLSSSIRLQTMDMSIFKDLQGFERPRLCEYNDRSHRVHPGSIESGEIGGFTPNAKVGSYNDVGAWLFHLRTTEETNGYGT